MVEPFAVVMAILLAILGIGIVFLLIWIAAEVVYESGLIDLLAERLYERFADDEED